MEQPRRIALRRWTGPVISIVVAVGTMLFLARLLGGEGRQDLMARVRAADPRILAAAAGLNLARYVVWAARWQILLRPSGRVKLGQAFSALLASLFLTTVLPVARPFGGWIRARHLSRASGLPVGPIFGVALIDQLAYSVSSTVCGALFLPWAFLPQSRDGGTGMGFLSLGGLLLVLGVVLGSWRSKQIAAWVSRRLPKASAEARGALEAAGQILRWPTAYWVAGLGGCLVWFSNAMVIWVVAQATGTEVSISLAAAAWAMGSLVGALTGTPGGVGTTEGAALVPMTAQGIPVAEALAIILMARGLHYATALGVGGACFLQGRRRGEGAVTLPEA